MRTSLKFFCGSLEALVLSLSMPLVEAAITSLGPTPYLSRADSPFPVDGSSPSFHLEDFEDGQLNTPGIYDLNPPATRSSVQLPGILTDSVDEDDGAIDGNGQDGHSVASSYYFRLPLDPPVTRRPIDLAFEPVFGGMYPNAFGFVWTDGLLSSTVEIRIYGINKIELDILRFHDLGDSHYQGTTSDDRFIGFIATEEVAFVTLTAIFVGGDSTFEIDHISYGRIVAEPTSCILSAMLCAFLTFVPRECRT